MPRRTLRELLEDLTNSTIKGDSKTLRSIAALIGAPGSISAAQLSRRAADFVTPIKLFFAILVFYTLFFAISPVKFGQLWIGLASELPGYDPEPVVPGQMPWFGAFVEFFVAEREHAVTPMLEDHFEAAGLDPAEASRTEPGVLTPMLALIGQPDRQRKLMELTTLMLSYCPLFVMIPVILLNGLLYRGRRFIVEHINFSFEAASVMPLLIMGVGALVALANALGLEIPGSPNFSPVFMYAVVPTFALVLAIADRRYYHTPWLLLLPKAGLLVFAWYWLTNTIMVKVLTFAATRAI